MKLIALILIAFTSATIYSQISFNTGSTELDANLNTINADAEVDLGIFKADLSAEFNVTTKKLDYMFSIGMEAGEVYLSLEISSIANKPIDDVVKSYSANKSKGWGYIAKEMGIKPGSAEFHALKGNSKNKKEKNKGGKGNGKGNGHGNSKGKKK
jgi:hypothetical protein